jgi:ankyrin repeat protein
MERYNAPKHQGSTALMAAAAKGRIDVIKFLLAKGADRYMTDRRDKTALAYAKMPGDDATIAAVTQTRRQ